MLLNNALLMTSGRKLSATPPTSLTDGNGNVYSVVQIGTQYWMATNLNATKLMNSTNLSYGGPGVGLYYKDGEQGKIYSWEALSGIAPAGWRVPSNSDWNTLAAYYGGATVAGGWASQINMSAYPFNAIPTGIYFSGMFYDNTANSGWWQSNSYYGRNMTNTNNYLYASGFDNTSMLSCRLIWAG